MFLVLKVKSEVIRFAEAQRFPLCMYIKRLRNGGVRQDMFGCPETKRATVLQQKHVVTHRRRKVEIMQ